MIWESDDRQQFHEGPSSTNSTQEMWLTLLHFNQGTRRERSNSQYLSGFEQATARSKEGSAGVPLYSRGYTQLPSVSNQHTDAREPLQVRFVCLQKFAVRKSQWEQVHPDTAVKLSTRHHAAIPAGSNTSVEISGEPDRPLLFHGAVHWLRHA